MRFEQLDLKSKLSPHLYEANLPELASLFRLSTSERIIATLEFGSGYSTLVLAAALDENLKIEAQIEVRHPNPWQLQTVDCSEKYLDIALARVGSHNLKSLVRPVISKATMGLFEGRACHYFSNLPPFTADLVYLDGPDPGQVEGHINGHTVAFGDKDRTFGLPMSADILQMEFMFWPGTYVVVDGRGANAEFLRRSLARDWIYCYSETLDQHFFRLEAQPWGLHSKKLLSRRTERTLGEVVRDCEVYAERVLSKIGEKPKYLL